MIAVPQLRGQVFRRAADRLHCACTGHGEAVLAFDRVMGITVVVAALEVALVSILAGLFAVLYNLTVGITGGVEATFTTVSLSKDGTEVAIKGLETPDADKKTLVVTPAAPLAAGNYKVVWNAVSVDTHKSNGEYSFKVGQ